MHPNVTARRAMSSTTAITHGHKVTLVLHYDVFVNWIATKQVHAILGTTTNKRQTTNKQQQHQHQQQPSDIIVKPLKERSRFI